MGGPITVTEDAALPHTHLYTRLRLSPGRGVGVFAIRAIPAGLNPFMDENCPAVQVPAPIVEALEPALRQMYVDFCPLVAGCYVAPASFNQMTIAWYMNHGDKPNVASGPRLHFVTLRAIEAGEELTVDYTTFSDHARRFVTAWAAGASAD